MTRFSKPNKKILTYLVAAAGVILGLVLVLHGIAVANQKKILEAATRSINEKISGRVEIDDLSFSLFEYFPSLSVRLKGISITDSLVHQHGDTLLRARSLTFRLKTLKLITGSVVFSSIKLEDASIKMLKTAAGYSNTHLAKKSATTSEKKSGRKTPFLNKAKFENVYFRFVDSSKMKFFGFTMVNTRLNFSLSDSVVFVNADGPIKAEHLIFNIAKGGYLTQTLFHLDMRASFDLRQLVLNIPEGTMKVDDQRVQFKGRFALKGEPSMKLHFESIAILPETAYALLTPAISQKLNTYKPTGPVMMSAFVEGPMAVGSKPEVDVYFKSENNSLTFAGRTFGNLKFIGQFTNHIDSAKINDDHNSRVYLPVFRGDLYGLPFSAQMTISDLLEPVLGLQAHVFLKMETGEKVLNSPNVVVYSGLSDIRLKFFGPLVNYVDTAAGELKATVRGSVLLQDLSFDLVPLGYRFRDVNGYFNFDENDLNIDSLMLTINHNTGLIRGQIRQFISFIFLPTVKADAKLQAHISDLVFDSLAFSPPPGTAENEPSKTTRKTPSKKENKLAGVISWLVNNLELNFDLTADRIVYKRFVATGLRGQLLISSRAIVFRDSRMNTGGGYFQFSGNLSNLQKKIHTLDLTASIRQADIGSIMYAFDDFGQKAITHQNISGKVTADTWFTTELTKNYKVITPSIRSEMHVKIQDGELRNLEGLQEVQKYVFKNRDLNNIQFAEITASGIQTGSVLNISQIDVFSSAFTFYISGKYDLNKSETDLLFTIPLSNLKKEGARERMSRSEADKSKGNILLRMTHGNDGKLKVMPVLFRKKKDEAGKPVLKKKKNGMDSTPIVEDDPKK